MPTILVIDDEEQIRRYISLLLEEEGYVVRQARNGEEGIQECERELADLVLCDIFMDRMDGLETTRQLLDKFPEAKIIAMSGGSAKIAGDYLHDAEAFGALATVNKPLEKESFLQTVKEVLRK